ncbi:MAG: RpiB/LacA/LacB family sugar-phosphate isomerase [bacterium]|nr:RpiB/LacA/LacB family sugar-phosphate isomerase [bacterium]
MKVYLGTDHAGFALKEKLKRYLADEGHEVEDMGAHSLNDQDDYPDFIRLVAEAVARDDEGLAPSGSTALPPNGRGSPLGGGTAGESRGVVLGGSGQGEAMVANRIRGVRAAVYYGGDKEIIVLSREHNDANILSLGARFLSDEEAKSVVKLWLETEFKGEERHVRRIKKIDD